MIRTAALATIPARHLVAPDRAALPDRLSGFSDAEGERVVSAHSDTGLRAIQRGMGGGLFDQGDSLETVMTLCFSGLMVGADRSPAAL